MDERLLPVVFYRRPGIAVARDLLGRVLARRLPGGAVLRAPIVEVEAYDGPLDRASHAYPGRTARNAPMFRGGGIAYVYLIYGMHHCLNLVTGEEGHPSAVLLRAAAWADDPKAASGPGKLARAFGIDRTLNGASLLGPDLWLEEGSPVPDPAVARSRRIGVDYAGAWASRRLRFFVRGHPSVSGPKRMR
ncbi:MAG TPA: DNA-3-methyladenine glycosylase [Candidatus Polarisedimenticolaceae bacterium]|nr:DNA-3-methyladenine glycosylase [Candidatus Polarisedimenticolaceae bacterium]